MISNVEGTSIIHLEMFILADRPVGEITWPVTGEIFLDFKAHISGAKPDCDGCDDSLPSPHWRSQFWLQVCRSDWAGASHRYFALGTSQLCHPLILHRLSAASVGGGRRREGQLELSTAEFHYFISNQQTSNLIREERTPRRGSAWQLVFRL